MNHPSIPFQERWYNRTVQLVSAILARHPTGILKRYDEAPLWLRFLSRIGILSEEGPWVLPWGRAYLPSPIFAQHFHFLFLAYAAAAWDIWRYGRSMLFAHPSPLPATLRPLSWVGRLLRLALFLAPPLPFLNRYRERVCVACYVRPLLVMHMLMGGEGYSLDIKQMVMDALCSWHTGWACLTRWRAEEVFASCWQEIIEAKHAGTFDHLLDT